MGFSTPVRGSVAIEAAESVARIHADHANGTLSLALTDELSPVSIYVRGTADELLDLAARIVAAVPTPDRPRSLGETLIELDVANVERERAERRGDNPDNVFACSGCGADLTHDCARYYYCTDTRCDAYRHTILMGADGTRSVVGMIR